MNQHTLSLLLATLTLTLANNKFISLDSSPDPFSFENGTWIIEASATLVLPELPAHVNGSMDLWSAIMMEGTLGALQGISHNSDPKSWPESCPDTDTKWCNHAYDLLIC